MGRISLTDRFIHSRKAAAPGRREDHFDALVPGLSLRVTDRGSKSFVLVARYPLRPLNPTRRSLGTYGQITLDEARQKAREWLSLIQKGIDPAIEEERRRAAARVLQANTFEAVANAFLNRYAAQLAKAGEARAIVAKEFMPRWHTRLITEITPKEAAEAIRAIAERGAPYQAYNAFGWLRRLYNWAINSGEHGVETSPVECGLPSSIARFEKVIRPLWQRSIDPAAFFSHTGRAASQLRWHKPARTSHTFLFCDSLPMLFPTEAGQGTS